MVTAGSCAAWSASRPRAQQLLQIRPDVAQGPRGWVHPEQTPRAVHGHHVARGDLLRDAAGADHRRSAPGPGHDRGVAGRATDVGDEGGHPAGASEHRRVGRGEVVGDDHRALRDLLLHVDHLAEQVPDDAVGDEVHVGPALAEVLVGDLVEEVLDLPGDASDRPLGVDLVGGDELVDLVDQHRVAQHQAVGLEDERVVLAVALLEPVLELEQLVLGEVDGGLEPHQLPLHLLGAELQLRGADPAAVEHEGAPHGHAGAGPDGLQLQADRLGAHRVTFTAPPRSGWR